MFDVKTFSDLHIFIIQPSTQLWGLWAYWPRTLLGITFHWSISDIYVLTGDHLLTLVVSCE